MIFKHQAVKEKIWKKHFAFLPLPIGTYPLQEGQPLVWLQWLESKWLDCRGSNTYENRLPCLLIVYNVKVLVKIS
jgi:hypothetical protein